MDNRVNLLNRAKSLDASPLFQPYSKVVIHVGNNEVISVGNDTGRTLEYDDPFGTKEQAEKQLAKLRGFQYQPYDAKSAFLNPAAEIGDGVSIKNIYGGLYSRSRQFGRLMAADIAAPSDKEINHEYNFKTPTERSFERSIGDVRASIKITATQIMQSVSKLEEDTSEIRSDLNQQADEISAKVSATRENESFSWSLTADGHRWYDKNHREVVSITEDGVSVTGIIKATSGSIGGFKIGTNGIYNGLQSFNGTQTTGVYVGTDGIQLGQNFKVSASGSMELAGTLTIGGTAITAQALRGGAQTAWSNGGTWTSTSNAWANATNGNGPNTFSCGTLYNTGSAIWVNRRKFVYKQTTIAGTTIEYLGLSAY